MSIKLHVHVLQVGMWRESNPNHAIGFLSLNWVTGGKVLQVYFIVYYLALPALTNIVSDIRSQIFITSSFGTMFCYVWLQILTAIFLIYINMLYFSALHWKRWCMLLCLFISAILKLQPFGAHSDVSSWVNAAAAWMCEAGLCSSIVVVLCNV